MGKKKVWKDLSKNKWKTVNFIDENPIPLIYEGETLGTIQRVSKKEIKVRFSDFSECYTDDNWKWYNYLSLKRYSLNERYDFVAIDDEDTGEYLGYLDITMGGEDETNWGETEWWKKENFFMEDLVSTINYFHDMKSERLD
jgi:hypothetical protein